ncbi:MULTISPECIES: DNA-binding protein [Prauserella salsuginis group]|uniref:DNA-binding protein n=1 Tax=Prauserella salsuginis TaxID=387889 RepID=A0ABW6GBS3_9PSEU|nr:MULTISPECIES: DNA-binding protein [Prauserella salsuginis group]MCR3721676.1 putative DNA-binding protein with PD1-like DNA-binding motif [Prauserella flava]MCR3734368.1 putative DNA-binding protein with PD1-like DNA-binding motif [Prauserella salsuginis]
MTAHRAGFPLQHPGPRSAERIVSVPTGVTVVRTELPPGARVAAELWRITESAGHRAACVELVHGSFGTLRYVHPAVGAERPAYFSETYEPAGPCFVLGGSATVGSREGSGFAHVHATWLDEHGRVRGGHLLPDTTVGAVPIEATMRLLHDVAYVSDTCPETAMPAFSPHPRWEAAATQAVAARIRPGEDLHTAVTDVAARAGFRSAVVRASLGSTVGARLRTGPGRIAEADWPATEFTSLTGTVADGEAVLTASLVDRNGDVHSGLVLPGQNPVAVTFELYVERADSGAISRDIDNTAEEAPA